MSDAELVPIGQLRQDEDNVRRHDERNLAAIRASLEAFGQRKPIVVDDTGRVLAGNGTLTAAQELGWTQLWARRYDGPPEEARAFALADNRTAELATWDRPLLAAQLEQLADSAWAPATGFEPGEVKPRQREQRDGARTDSTMGERKETYEASDTRELVLDLPVETYRWVMERWEPLRAEHGGNAGALLWLLRQAAGA